MMTEEEALIRAREACIARWPRLSSTAAQIRAGEDDGYSGIQTALRALLDANKPLSEVAPFDPDLIEAREVVAQYWDEDGSPGQAVSIRSGLGNAKFSLAIALAGIKRGRALASVAA